MFALCIVAGIRAGALINTTDLILPDVVSPESLPKAYGANQARDATLSLLAAPLGGVLMRVWIVLPVVMEAAAAAFTALALRGISTTRADGGERREKLLAYAFAGVRRLLIDKTLRHIATTSVLLMGTLNAVTVSCVVAARAMGYTVLQVSLVDVTTGLGILIGSLLVSRMIPKVRSGRTVTFCIVWMAGFFSLAAASSNPVIVLVILFLTTLPLALASAVIGGYLAYVIPAEQRGRFFSALSLFSFAGTAVLLSVFGVISNSFGVHGVFVASACLMAVTVVFTLFSRPIAQIPPPSEWQPDDPD